MSEDRQLVLPHDEIPQPGTEPMIRTLHSVMEQLLAQLPFPFMAADVMSAASALLVDAGMISVMEGQITKDVLKQHIREVVDAYIDGWNPDHSNITSDLLRERKMQ